MTHKLVFPYTHRHNRVVGQEHSETYSTDHNLGFQTSDTLLATTIIHHLQEVQVPTSPLK